MRKFMMVLAVLLVGLSTVSIVRGKDKPNEGSWELLSKIDLNASLDPWPAKQGGAVTIHVVAVGDPDTKFSGSVEYRVTTTEKGDGPWKPMKQVAAKGQYDVGFEAAATLPKAAKVFVQFKVKETGEEKATELTDWAVDLEP